MEMGLTQAQIDYLRGVDIFEIGKRHGIHGLEEIKDKELLRRALHLAMKGEVKDREVLEGILNRTPLWVRIKEYLTLFLDTGFDRAVVYSSMVSCSEYNFLKLIPEGFESLAQETTEGYKLKHVKLGKRVFNDMIYPDWRDFVDLIEQGVNLRLRASYKKKNILLTIKTWGELGEVLLGRLNGSL